jgi:predicted GNAT family N-acyltransferase
MASLASPKQKSQKGHYHFQAPQMEEEELLEPDDSGPPTCRVCQHRHVGKCHICGHVLNVKSKIFSASACPEGTPTQHALHFEMFSPSRPETFESGWSLAKILRRNVFVEELKGEPFPGAVCEQMWSVEIQEDDTTCQHTIGYYGDMPVTTCRWRIVTQQDGTRMFKLDRMCVLPRYRQRKVFSFLIENCVKIAQKQAETLNVTSLLFCCPNDLSFLETTLRRMNFEPFPGQQFTDDGRVRVPFVRRLPCYS